MLLVNHHGHLVTTDNTGKEITVVGLTFHPDIYAKACIRYAFTGQRIKPEELVSYKIANVRL
jgi:hypothetical protein